MRNRMKMTWRVACALLVLLLGTLAGTDPALATDPDYHWYSSGWAYYQGYHELYSPPPPPGLPSWFFYEDHWAWADSDQSYLIIDDTHILDNYYHDPRTSDNVWFLYWYFGDANQNHLWTCNAFRFAMLRDLNSTRDTYWAYDGLGPSNPYAYVHMPIGTVSGGYFDDEITYFLY
jgi:hypothetical protein